MRAIAVAVLLGVIVSAPALAAPSATPPIIPDTPAGHALAAWLEAFNSGDRARLEAYHAQYDPNLPVEQTLAFRRETGGFTLQHVDASERLHIEFRVQEKASPRVGMGAIDVKDAQPPAPPMMIESFMLQALPPGADPAKLAITVDAAARTRIIDGIAARLNELYVFPDVAQKMVAALRAHQKSGDYDKVTSGYSFAARLTGTLQAVSHDKHLRVRCVPMSLPPDPRNPLDKPPLTDEDRAQMQSENCGFKKVDELEHNIGYVKLNFFGPPEACGATATAAMNLVAHVDALIIDLRDNGGGSPEQIAWLASYLFAARTHLNDLYQRKRNKTEESWTNPDVPGLKLVKAPVYVLTSAGTFSGGEELAYDLQNLKRATIVGEATGGGAHPTTGVRVDEHFMVGVPFACAINPYSKTNWEGTGVTPDVKVPADQALDVAKKLALEVLAKNAPPSPPKK